VDIWSLGCILFEMCSGDRAFENDYTVFHFRVSSLKFTKPIPEWHDSRSAPIFTRWISEMLEMKPEKRPSAESLGNRLDELFDAVMCPSPNQDSGDPGFFVDPRNILGTSLPSSHGGFRWERIFTSGNYTQHKGTLERYLHLAKVRTRVLGSQDRNTIYSCLCYAWGSFYLGPVDQARKAFEEVATIQRIMFDGNQEHPELLITESGIAWTHGALGHDSICKALFRRILGIQQSALGADHPQTLDTMFGLAACLRNLRDKSAVEMFEQTIEMQSRTLGPGHASTLLSKAGLASAYVRFGKNEDALRLFEEAVKLQTELLGSEHVETLSSLSGQGWVLMLMGESGRAAPILEDVATRQTRLLGIHHSVTQNTFEVLERVYGKRRAMEFRKKLKILED
jgi:tetratricopeptide (TPR) repeat protein